jgi:hypothetical protein
MRKSLMIVLTLGVFAFVASEAGAKQIIVRLTPNQVATVCGSTNYCEKSCGLNGEYKCGFGCGTSGCSGVCLTCPTGRRTQTRTINTAVTTAAKNIAICTHNPGCRLCCRDRFGSERCTFDIWKCGM